MLRYAASSSDGSAWKALPEPRLATRDVSQARMDSVEGRVRRPDQTRERTAAWFSARGKGTTLRLRTRKVRVGFGV